MTTPETEAAIIADLDAIEAAPPPCLPDALCECPICTRYCALWTALDGLRDETEKRPTRRRSAV